ncbi:MAG: hypothetical protein KA146_00470 [Leptospiraceae bacterium]|jgi:hypothetical protein|nr:hypothetical protein [Leptospiraceae bacterium]
MANQVRNYDFVTQCKELYSKGYTMRQIADKLKQAFKRPTLCRRTVWNAIHFGVASA